jgi:hypothetical protein
MIDNDLKDKCSIDHSNQTIEHSLEKIDNYLKNFSSFNQKKNLAKVKFLSNLIFIFGFGFRNFFHLLTR